MGFITKSHQEKTYRDAVDITDDNKIKNHETLEKFRSFLRSLMMHAGVGTALGGVMTMVGNLKT